MRKSVLFWQRTDILAIERLELLIEPDRIVASSVVTSLEANGFRLDHHWLLRPDWQAQSVTIERWNSHGQDRLTVERAGTGWRVDGERRPDLEGAAEIDLSVTPFCNSFVIRRIPDTSEATETIDTVFIDGPSLDVSRSRQRYVRQGPNRLRYVDLGLYAGFEADLLVDDSGLILRYEHLFERIAPDREG